MAADEENRLAEQVLAQVEREHVRYINLQFVDIAGVVKSVTIPSHELEDCITNGKWFDGSSIEGFARVAESDMFLKPDLRTFALVPWQRNNTTNARVICWVYTPHGEHFPGDPRFVLRSALAEAEQLGFDFYAGPEFEFFVFDVDEEGGPRLLPEDRAGYFDLSSDVTAHLREEMVSALEELGVPIDSSHHESGTNQHEIDMKYDHALKAADSAVTLKYAVKAVAQRAGYYASFMPKPLHGVAGSGMHVHQSLFRRGTQENQFFAAEDLYGLSDLAKHFLAGQLHHARSMCAVMAPLTNSYKRLVPGYEAPVFITWARINRSGLIRIPKFNPGNPQAARIELRCPDPSCNPYLALAVMLKAGLDGVRRELPLAPPVEENLYLFDRKRLKQREVQLLPASLGEALTELQRDSVVQEALGEHVYQRFVEAKQLEWDDYRKQVTPWEVRHYFPIY
ncbi:MAG: glutamine synthetase family protein [Chloroflexota bacterium]